MRNIRLTLQYEGTNYHGWQWQRPLRNIDNGPQTIQAVMEQALSSFTGENARLTGAGRTDAGVHALGQVAAFKTESSHSTETIGRALNALLPADIRVVEVSEADSSFHPRYEAKGKSYFYLISCGDCLSPFLERYVWRVPLKLDVRRMEEAGRLFLGRRDFRAFMGAGSSVKNTVREIRSLNVHETAGIEFLSAKIRGRFLKISLEADGFLRHMARNIVGTLVEIGRGRALEAAAIMESGDRRLAGPTAPAKGLFLERVFY